MKEILPEVEAWREAGEKVVVATVVATRRSAPRPVGTSLAVSESGKMCGSVSGGCVESDVFDNAMEVMRTGEPKLLHYGISDDRRPAKQLRGGAQRLRRVDRAVDEQPRRRAVPLGEDLRPVRLHETVAAAAHDLVELLQHAGGHAVADRLAALDDKRLRADAVSLDDCEEDGPPATRAERDEPTDESCAHSTSSTKTSISPPQGSPTDHARSSEMP